MSYPVPHIEPSEPKLPATEIDECEFCGQWGEHRCLDCGGDLSQGECMDQEGLCDLCMRVIAGAF